MRVLVGRLLQKRDFGWVIGWFTLLCLLGIGVVAANEFNDDDGGVHEPAIDALAVRGILAGTECGEGLICPKDPIERWVMAVWLVRSLDGADPVGVTPSGFTDVDPDEWWAPYVDRLAELGVTKGCSTTPRKYCPDQPVTRAEMATFLTRAFFLHPGPEAGFVDTADNSHLESINALAQANITRGCAINPPKYCPDQPVTRAEMATFLARALKLIPLPPAIKKPTTRIAFTRGHSAEYWGIGLRNGGRTRMSIGETVNVFVADPDTSFLFLSDFPTRQRPEWSPDGTKVAYTSGRRGVYVIDADGSNRIELTNDYGAEGLAWSPDSSQIAFRLYGKLFVIDADGSNHREITKAFGAINPVWSPDGTQIVYSGNGGIYAVDPDGANVRTLNPDPWASDPWWSPDGSRIVYASRDKIFVMDSDGNNPEQLSGDSNNHLDHGPVWSHDGTRIAFIREYLENPDTISRDTRPVGIFVMDADGRNVEQLTDNQHGDFDPAWSHDDRRIAFTRYEGPFYSFKVHVIDADGSNLQRLANNQINDFGPSWSSDDTRIAVTSDIGVVVIEVDDSDPRQITNNSVNASPAWSPDGTQIAFASDRNGNLDLFVMDADGDSVEQLTDTEYDEVSPIWSPDGTRIAFTRDTSFVTRGIRLEINSRSLFVIDSDGSNEQQLTGRGFSEDFLSYKHFLSYKLYWYDVDPAWSPDGTQIAFTSDRYNYPEVFVVEADGSGEQRLTNSDDTSWSNGAAAWSPDGTQIAFTRHGEIYLMNANGSNQHRLTYNFEDDASPVWSPDGARILFQNASGISVVGADGADETQLASSNYSTDESPVWSPDSTQIAFTRGQILFVVDADGANETPLDYLRFVYQWEPKDPTWSPDGAQIAYSFGGGIFVVDADGANGQQLTDNFFWNEDTSVWAPDGSALAFIGNTDGLFSRIVLQNTDGTNLRRLTTFTDSWERQPTWSPDSTQIAYIRFDGMYANDVNGANQRKLADGTIADMVWSPNGARIAFTRDNRTFTDDDGMYVIDADGANQTKLTDIGAAPVWSPDGTRIVYASYDGMYVIDADGANQTKLTPFGTGPVWSPDGTRILYTRYDGAYVIDADGANQTRVTETASAAVWAVDGTRVTCASRGGIIVVDADAYETAVQQLTFTTESRRLAWSPDGTSLLFESLRPSNPTEVFLVNADGANQRQLTYGGGVDPRWLFITE